MKNLFEKIWWAVSGKSPKYLAYLIFTITPIFSAILAVESYKEHGYFVLGIEVLIPVCFIAMAFYLLWVDSKNNTRICTSKLNHKHNRYVTYGSLNTIELPKHHKDTFKLV